MSDTETTPAHAAETHSDQVARVMSAVSQRIDAGADAHEALRDTLGAEGLTLTDLPEVGMWFAMSQMGASFAAPAQAVEPVVDLTGSNGVGEPVEIDLRELATEIDRREPPPQPIPALIAEGVPDTIERALPQEPPPTAPTSTEPDAATRRRRANRLSAFLRATLDDRRTRDAIRDGLDTHSVAAPTPSPAGGPAEVLAPAAHREPTPVLDPTPVEPDNWATFSDDLRSLAAELGPIAIDDPSTVGSAVPSPYWSPRSTRALRDAATTRAGIATTDVAAAVDRSLATFAPLAVGAARPSPYWPRHLVRTGRVPDGREHPRSAEKLERDVARRFAIVRLAGQAELADDRVEIELALVAGLRRHGIDKVAARWPAILLAGMVLGAIDPDDETVAELVRAVGLEELVTSTTGRRHRTLELHLALRDDLDSVVHEVHVARAAGATTARDVARFWALGGANARDRLGEIHHELFVWTPVGEAALAEILAIIEDSDAGGRRGDHARLQPIPTSRRRALAPTTADAIRDAARGLEPIPALRVPEVRLLPADDGPVAILPAGSSRWHLNGELLGYGAHDDDKVVPLSPPRRHGWAITSRAVGGRSGVDVLVRSATAGDTVLVFDELGRVHPPDLPVSGAAVTIVAPAGSALEPVAADEVVGRRALGGAWAGFERIEIAPVTHRGRWRVVTPQRSRLDIVVDRTVGATIFAQVLGGVAGRRRQPVIAPTAFVELDGHPHPVDDLRVTVRAGRRERDRPWSDLTRVDGTRRRSFPLVGLAGGAVELTVERDHHDPTRAAFVVAPASLSVDGDRLELEDGWCSAPAVVLLDASQRPQQIELRNGDRRLRLRARLSVTGPSDRTERAWWEDPVAAAALDDWSAEGAPERWERWTGWVPPTGPTLDEGMDALSRLVRPLARTVAVAADRPSPATTDGMGAPIAQAYAALRREEWVRVARLDGDALQVWAARFGRFARQMRSRDEASSNLAPVWGGATGPLGPLVDLVTVAVVAHRGGPHAVPAVRPLGEAAASAPHAARAAGVFGIAYATLQRTHPPTRFRSLV